MPSRAPASEMRAALDAHIRTTANLKALNYAPWVLSLLAVIVLWPRAAELAPSDWLHVGIMVAVLPLLAQAARRALARHHDQAERTIENLLQERGGFDALARLQESSRRYRTLELSTVLRHQVVFAALSRQDELDTLRRRRERERVDRSLAAH